MYLTGIVDFSMTSGDGDAPWPAGTPLVVDVWSTEPLDLDGAWRIPPKAGARWVAPSWTPRRGRVVLVPGGWSIRIGR
jgi:hypothetical protein